MGCDCSKNKKNKVNNITTTSNKKSPVTALQSNKRKLTTEEKMALIKKVVGR